MEGLEATSKGRATGVPQHGWGGTPLESLLKLRGAVGKIVRIGRSLSKGRREK